jgi:ribosomal protein S27E
MLLERKLVYTFFAVTLSIWFVSLFTVCSTRRETTAFPSADVLIVAVFSISAVLFVVTSFSIGLNKLGILSRARATFVKVRCGNCGFLNLIPAGERLVLDKPVKCEKCGNAVIQIHMKRAAEKEAALQP